MRQQRVRLVVNVGNLLELAGASAAVYGLYRLAGLGFALLLAGVLAVAAAELVYDAHVWRLPLPRRPRPRLRAQELRSRLASKHAVRRHQRALRRARRSVERAA